MSAEVSLYTHREFALAARDARRWGEVEFGQVAPAGGADVEQRAAVAFRFGESAEGLSVELDERVVLVEHGGVPGFGD